MSARPPRGRFIVLEGLDGAGTTTQSARLADALRARGKTVLATREPSDGPVGTLIRQALTHRLVLPDGKPPAPETLALLFAADRTDHLRAKVLPALEAGIWVLSDRYVLSSLAYQGASLPMAWVNEINAEAVPADLTLFVAVALKTAAKRRSGRGGQTELFEAEALQKRIATAYEAAISLRGRDERLVRVPGDGPVDAVTRACLAALEPLLSDSPPAPKLSAARKKSH